MVHKVWHVICKGCCRSYAILPEDDASRHVSGLVCTFAAYCVGRNFPGVDVFLVITRVAYCRYPRACHLICLRVGAEAAKLASTDRGVSSREALTPSKGKGRAMHGQRMVEWLEVRRRGVTLFYHSLMRFGSRCCAAFAAETFCVFCELL